MSNQSFQLNVQNDQPITTFSFGSSPVLEHNRAVAVFRLLLARVEFGGATRLGGDAAVSIIPSTRCSVRQPPAMLRAAGQGLANQIPRGDATETDDDANIRLHVRPG